MSIFVYAWNDFTGGFAQYDDRLRVATLEVTTMAEEFQSGASDVVLDDSTADFYVYPYRPMYFVETAAYGDPYFGIIGPVWTERRVVERGNERTGSRRVWTISVRDINSLLALRIQKGTDAERDAETDVERVTWLIGTAEVIGGFGDNGYTIEETEFFFTDGPVDMSESDYTFQYSEGVLRDCLDQGATKNGFLYPAPTSGSDPTRIGIWYGTDARADFASLHKISNDLDDISPEVLTGFAGVTPQYSTGYVFPPSQDMRLDRDPTRTITGAGLQWDGANTYLSNGTPGDVLTRRDMVFAGELVKNVTQAGERLAAILDTNDTEDDAITCSVVVPDWLVHAFVAGNRVQFKATHLASLGYEDYVWMRVAKVTTRHIAPEGGSPGVYELALDLRAESPPGPEEPTPPVVTPVACEGGTPEGIEAHSGYPMGVHSPPNGNAAPTPSPGLVQYFRAGISPIFSPSTTAINSWHFPTWGAGGFGTVDAAGRNAGNSLRLILVSQGTMTVDAFFSGTTTGTWRLFHMDGDIEVEDDSGTGIPGPISAPDDGFCYHILSLGNWNGTSGGFWFQGYSWDPVTT